MEQQPKAIVSVPPGAVTRDQLHVCVLSVWLQIRLLNQSSMFQMSYFQWGKSYCPKLIVSFFLVESQDRMKVSDVFRTIWEQISSQGAFYSRNFIKSRQQWFFFVSGGLQAKGYMRVKNHGWLNWEVKNEENERKASLRLRQHCAAWCYLEKCPALPSRCSQPGTSPSPGVLGGCANLLLGWQFFMPPSSITISPFLPDLSCFIDF